MASVLRVVRAREGDNVETDGLQSYLDRLLKLIPAEVVGLYLVGVGAIPAGENIGLAVWPDSAFSRSSWCALLPPATPQRTWVLSGSL